MEKKMERGHPMKTMSRACALSATAAAATVLLVGNVAAADDAVLTRKRSTLAIEHVAASLHQPAQLGTDFIHQRATQWGWRSGATEQASGDDGVD